LIRTCISIIAQIRTIYVENFGLMALASDGLRMGSGEPI
jgi:hypothetical protein